MKIYSAFKLGLDASLIFFMQAMLLGKHDNKLEVATEYSRPPAVGCTQNNPVICNVLALSFTTWELCTKWSGRE